MKSIILAICGGLVTVSTILWVVSDYQNPPDIQGNMMACNHPDSAALMVLYNALGGPGWLRGGGWGQNCDVCTWAGVFCDANGRVDRLLLSNNNMIGTIPAEIGLLTELTILQMGSNQLTGSIPDEIGNLTKLEHLTLSFNALGGPLPATVGNLQALKHLDLGLNQLNGSLPSSLGNLSALQYLSLSDNSLGGSIPNSLTNLTELTDLGMAGNNLSGPIPSNIGNLVNLQTLSLSSNLLDGSIPQSVGFLSELNNLYLHQNNLSGEIPSAIGNLLNLTFLRLDFNNLSGGLPPSIGNLPMLDFLWLNNNNLDGCYPESFSSLCGTGVWIRMQNNPCFFQGTFDGFCFNPQCYFNDFFLSGPDFVCLGDTVVLWDALGNGSTYQWSTGATTSFIQVSPTTNTWYHLEAITSQGCTRLDSVFVRVLPNVVAKFSSTDVTIAGGSDGTATISPSGGTGVYSYFWSTNETTQSISRLSAGTYYGTVTDANGCLASASVVIKDPVPCPTINLNLSSTDISCFGGDDGSASLAPQGGVGPYGILWSSGATTIAIADLAPGNYQVTVTDANGCADTSATFFITEPPELSSSIIGTHETALGANDGAADLLVNGGTSPYSFQWSNGATSEDISGLTGGASGTSYQVTIRDNSNCQITDQVIIYVNCPPIGTLCDDGNVNTFDDQEDGNCNCSGAPCPTININLTSTDVSCFGAHDGSASVAPQDGVGPYRILWSNGATTAAIANLASGIYQVTVTDANGCADTSTAFSITEPVQLSSSIAGTHETALGANDGAADLLVNGGTSPYSFLWSNGATSEDISGLAGGDTKYSVIITDAQGCAHNDIITIQTNCPPVNNPCDDGNANTFDDQEDGNCNCIGIPCPAINLNHTSTGISCFGADDGSASVAPQGGVGPYGILWSNGASTTAISHLAPGNYEVTVTDANGCADISTAFSITEPTQLSSSIIGTHETAPGANDGTADLTVNGGTSPYTFLWAHGATSQDISGLAGGDTNYSVIITDAQGCVHNDTITIQANCPLVGHPCDDGHANTFDDQEDGNCNCIGIPCPAINLNHTSTGISCFGADDGSASVAPQGGVGPYGILWSNGATTTSITNLAPGNYEVTVTDANGCADTSTAFSITEPPELSSSIIGTHETAPGANDGAADLLVNGGTSPYSFLWSNGATSEDISGLAGGDTKYSVIITDAQGCAHNDIITIQTNCPPVNNPCDDGNANTFDDQEDGNCNCIGIPCPAINLNHTSTGISCFGADDGSASVAPQGGVGPYGILWSNGATTTSITNLAPGNYEVTVTDANGCADTSTAFSITEPPELSSSIIGTHETAPGANDGAADLLVNGGTSPYSFLWSNGATSEDISGLAGGDTRYSVIITDAQGCAHNDIITIQTNCPPVNNPCDDGNANTFDDQEDGNCNCIGIPCPAINLNHTSTGISCFGADDGSASVAPQGGVGPYRILWSNGASTTAISHLAPGNYEVTVTDANGCADISTAFSITEPPELSSSIIGTHETAPGANDGTADLTVNGGTSPYTFLWAHGATSQDISGLAGGDTNYSVIITDAQGCVHNDTITIQANCPLVGHPCDDGHANTFDDQEDGSCNCAGTPCDTLSISLQIVDNNCFGEALGYAAVLDTSARRIQWSTGQIGPIASDLTNGNYQVTITNGDGCVSTNPFQISSPPQIDLAIEVSNASSPGGSNGAIDINIGGGVKPYKILWNTEDSTTFINDLFPGIYHIQIEDAQGCRYNDSVRVIDITCEDYFGLLSNSLSIQLDSIDHCDDLGSIHIVGAPRNDPLVWSIDAGKSYHSSSLFEDLPIGEYKLRVKNTRNGCEGSLGDVKLGQFVLALSDLMVNHPSDCSSIDGSIGIKQPDGRKEISLNAEGPWFTDCIKDLKSEFITIFTRNIHDSCIYVVVEDLKMGNPQETSIQTVVEDANLCMSGLGRISLIPTSDHFTFSIDGGNTWYMGEQTFSVSPGRYQPLVRDSLGCVQVLDTELLVNLVDELPDLKVQIQHTSGCETADGSFNITSSYHAIEISYDQGQTWTSDATIGSLTADIYQVWIRAQGSSCLDSITVEVLGEISEIEVDSLLLDPTCFGSNDGFIQNRVIDSIDHYHYSWSTGDTLPQVGSLSAGMYDLTITDEHSGCTKNFSFHLPEPLPLDFRLPPQDSLMLCQGETYVLELADTGYQYIWYKDESMLSVGRALTITGPGAYLVTAIDTQGCEGNDSLLIGYSSQVFHANFLMASQAVMDNPITAIEVSWPVPESIEWEIIGDAVIREDLNQAILQFKEPGMYSVLLRATNGQCMSTVEKTIEIVEDASQIDQSNLINPTLIRSAVAFPNPNTGNFNLLVELNELSDLQVRMYSEQGILVFAYQTTSTDTYSANIDLGPVVPGVYSVLIQLDRAWTSLSVVIE